MWDADAISVKKDGCFAFQILIIVESAEPRFSRLFLLLKIQHIVFVKTAKKGEKNEYNIKFKKRLHRFRMVGY